MPNVTISIKIVPNIKESGLNSDRGVSSEKFKQRRQALRGTIGSKICDPNLPLSAVGGAQREVGVTNFRPNGPTVLVLAPPGAHFWLSEFSPLSYNIRTI